MTTDKQAEANRLNAQKSTGPRTAEGKRRSALNALKSGIDAKTEVLFTEDPAQLEALKAEYFEQVFPVTPAERVQVDNQVRAEWRLRRIARIEAEIFSDRRSWTDQYCPKTALGNTFAMNDRMFLRLQRMRNDTERAYKNAQLELERLQTLRRAAEADTEVDAEAQPPAETGPETTGMASFFTEPLQPALAAPETAKILRDRPALPGSDAPPRCA